MPQDFSGQNLRGRSFKDQDLTGANFSHADIRGADFTNAKLIGANFTNAQAGLQRRWVIGLLIVSFILSAISGLASAIASSNVEYLFLPGSGQNIIAGITVSVVLAVFFIVIIRQGIEAALGIAAVAFTGAAVVAGTGAVTFSFAGTFVFAFAGAVTVAGPIAFAGAVTVAGPITVAFAAAFTFTGAINDIGTGTVAIAAAGIVILLSGYIAWCALKGDEKYALIRKVAVAFAAIGGTSLQGANLTDTNFTQARLKSTDLRNAILMKTCWLQAQKLDCARVGESYLKYSRVRQLVITGVGQDQNFDGLPLEGINLQGANLADANFSGANLNQANLQDIDLSRAKLKQTQLDGADLTGACLTGAYIEDWGITGETKLDRVRCEYVYMHVPTKDDPDPLRKPDNKQEVFEDSDFADFIKPIVDTLDLYHNQGVDPRAIAIAFKNLAESHQESELEIVAMEKKGTDKFLLRAKTAETADKSELSAEYFSTYNQLKSLPDHVRLLLAVKDDHIHSLENTVATVLQQPTVYAGRDVIMAPENPVNINVGRDISGVVNLGKIGRDVANTVNQLPSSPESNKPGIKELLTQLQAAIEAEADLTPEDKADALESVKTLAEVEQNPKKQEAEGLGRKAIKILKGTIASLPSAASLVEACNKLLPAITKLLGLG